MTKRDDDEQHRAENDQVIEHSLRNSVPVHDPIIAPLLREWSNARIHCEIRRGPEPGLDNEAFLFVRTCTLDRDTLKKYRWPESGRVIEFATDTLEQMRASLLDRRAEPRGPRCE